MQVRPENPWQSLHKKRRPRSRGCEHDPEGDPMKASCFFCSAIYIEFVAVDVVPRHALLGRFLPRLSGRLVRPFFCLFARLHRAFVFRHGCAHPNRSLVAPFTNRFSKALPVGPILPAFAAGERTTPRPRSMCAIQQPSDKIASPACEIRMPPRQKMLRTIHQAVARVPRSRNAAPDSAHPCKVRG